MHYCTAWPLSQHGTEASSYVSKEWDALPVESDKAQEVPQFLYVLQWLQSLYGGDLFLQWLYTIGSYDITQIVNLTLEEFTLDAFYFQVHVFEPFEYLFEMP